MTQEEVNTAWGTRERLISEAKKKFKEKTSEAERVRDEEIRFAEKVYQTACDKDRKESK